MKLGAKIQAHKHEVKQDETRRWAARPRAAALTQSKQKQRGKNSHKNKRSRFICGQERKRVNIHSSLFFFSFTLQTTRNTFNYYSYYLSYTKKECRVLDYIIGEFLLIIDLFIFSCLSVCSWLSAPFVSERRIKESWNINASLRRRNRTGHAHFTGGWGFVVFCIKHSISHVWSNRKWCHVTWSWFTFKFNVTPPSAKQQPSLGRTCYHSYFIPRPFRPHPFTPRPKGRNLTQ